MTLGEKIHSLRIMHGMTMQDLADMLGVQRSAVNKYEKGIVVNIRRSTIVSLCRIFNVPPSYFLEDDNDYLSPEESKLIFLYRGAEPTAQQIAIETLENHQKKDISSEAE